MGEIFSQIWNGFPFFCHTSINYERKNWEEKAMRNGKLCTGGLVFANKILAPKRSPHFQILEARELVKKIESEVECMGAKEFGEYHGRKDLKEGAKNHVD